MKVNKNLKDKMMKRIQEEITKKTKRKTRRVKNCPKKNPPKMCFNKFCKTFTVMLTNQVMIFLSWTMRNLMSF